MSNTHTNTQPTTRNKKATVSNTPTETNAGKTATKKTSAARSASAKAVTEASVPSAHPVGFVSFVGSGPGDPDLLTVRAVELLRTAEVVITDGQDKLQEGSKVEVRQAGAGQPSAGQPGATNPNGLAAPPPAARGRRGR